MTTSNKCWTCPTCRALNVSITCGCLPHGQRNEAPWAAEADAFHAGRAPLCVAALSLDEIELKPAPARRRRRLR